MYCEWLQARDVSKLAEWDEFLINSPRGHFCQLSTWLASFKSYGFSFRVLLARENPEGRIVGGIGIVRLGVPGLSYMCVPFGPILDTGYERHALELIEAALAFGERSGAALVQFQFPCSENSETPALLPSMQRPSRESFTSRERLVCAANEMLWVDLPQEPADDSAWREHMLGTFRQQTRRHIRTAERSDLEVHECKAVEDIQAAYALIEANGRARGYPTREWADFGPVLSEQIRKGQAVMLAARQNGQTLGAHYGVIAGRRYTAVMAGTMRVEGEGDVGHLLHWSAIKKARQLGLIGYDLTSSSVKGVYQFKMGFRPRQIQLVPPESYILSRWKYNLYNAVLTRVREHKASISRVLRFATKAFGSSARPA